MAINRAKVSRAAEKLLRQGRLEDAIREYKRLFDDNPQDTGTLNKVGDLYLKNNEVNSAVEMYERAAHRYMESGLPNNAIDLCNKLLRYAPGRTANCLRQVELARERGVWPQA